MSTSSVEERLPLELDGAYVPPQRVTIFSVYPQAMSIDISRRAPVSKFTIAAGTAEKPALLHVEDTWESEYGGEARGVINKRILAEHTARDVVEGMTVRIWGADGSTRSHPGIAICKGGYPTPDEIKDAVECQRRFFVLLVNSAREMERNNRRNDIQEKHRMAGRALGIKGESWQLDVSKDQQKKCSWCAEFIDSVARKCPKCHMFQTEQDAKAAAASGEMLPPSPGSGLPSTSAGDAKHSR